jgi:hypothetical protein
MKRYRIRVAVQGTPAKVFHDAVPDVQDELEQRPYLGHPRAIWDADRHQIVIELEDHLGAATF